MTPRTRMAWAVVGLLLAGLAAGAFSADAAPKKKGKAPKAPKGDTTAVLATLGSEVVTRAMVEERLLEIPEQYRAQYTTPEGRQQLVDRMIEERVWLLTAEREKIAEREDVRQALERQRRDLLVRTYLNERMATAPPVSDSVARTYYDEHLDDYRTPATVSLQHIQLKDERTAARVLQLARKGDPWAALVKRWSTDSVTHATEGALGTVTREGRFASLGAHPALAETALTKPQGSVFGPWKTDRGWHVFKVTAVTQDGVREFDQVRGLIVRQLSTNAQQDFYRELLENARRDLGVRVDSAAVTRYVSQKKSARDMFQEAQTIGPALARIDAYRNVVTQHPGADVSPQALFMVGFIHSEELNNYEEAEKAFRELLERYPDSELTDSARWMLEHMRTQDAPPFFDLDGDPAETASSGSAGKKDSSP